jgi:hypothetical protein
MMNYHMHMKRAAPAKRYTNNKRRRTTLILVTALAVAALVLQILATRVTTGRAIEDDAKRDRTSEAGTENGKESDVGMLGPKAPSATTISRWHAGKAPTPSTSPTGGGGGDSLAAGVLLGILKSSEPIKGKSMSADAFRARVETFRKYLEASDAVRRRWDAHFREARDRGIVIAAGRAGAILNAYVVIHTLRHATGCRLPVVVAHYGEAEFRATTREYFAAAFDDISFVDLEQVEYPTHHVPLESGGSRRELGYKLKIFSIYAAPFKSLIFMDADSTALLDPETLFDTQSYATHGNIFWNDFWDEPVPLWQLLHLETADPWRVADTQPQPLEAETGQIVLDRARHWKVLEWLLFLNTHDTLTYSYSMGDKDTFSVAFALAAGVGKDPGGSTTAATASAYNPSPWGPALPLSDLGPGGEERSDPHVRYRCLGMLQLHPENGEPFFHHRTADSKLTAHRQDSQYLSPITHITPPVTSNQASIMNWGAPGQSIHRATGRVAWGLNSASVRLMDVDQCPALSPRSGDEYRDEYRDELGKWPIRLDMANEMCTGRNETVVAANPEPILVVAVPTDSYVWRASTVEIDAYRSLPFQESD